VRLHHTIQDRLLRPMTLVQGVAMTGTRSPVTGLATLAREDRLARHPPFSDREEVGFPVAWSSLEPHRPSGVRHSGGTSAGRRETPGNARVPCRCGFGCDLLDAAKVEPTWRAAIVVGAETGLRMGEIIGLEWDDVDFRNRTLTVMRWEWQGHVGPPKGGRSRTIPLTERLIESLKGERHLRGPLVFCLDGGDHWGRHNMWKGLARASRRAKLRPIGWHMLRHTFCSHLAMRGAVPKAIQELAGHTTMGVTMRYMHMAPSALRDAISLLDDRSWQNRANEGKASEASRGESPT
jgi:hypothetical protein